MHTGGIRLDAAAPAGYCEGPCLSLREVWLRIINDDSVRERNCNARAASTHTTQF